MLRIVGHTIIYPKEFPKIYCGIYAGPLNTLNYTVKYSLQSILEYMGDHWTQ